MLDLLTATGCRPEAFRLCQKWMQAQTYRGPVRWIIVDDGPEPTPIEFDRDGWDVLTVDPLPFWEPGQNTQARNMLAGLLHVRGDMLAIIEDDDYYGPTWLDEITGHLQRHELVGARKAVYYNVRTRIVHFLKNNLHASLCATGLKGSAIQDLERACRLGPKFIDLELWKRGGHLFDSRSVIGMKGLPGRENIGLGKDLTGAQDRNHAELRKLIGSDVQAYAGF